MPAIDQLLRSAGDLAVLSARPEVAPRVVVGEDDVRCDRLDRGLEDLADVAWQETTMQLVLLRSKVEGAVNENVGTMLPQFGDDSRRVPRPVRGARTEQQAQLRAAVGANYAQRPVPPAHIQQKLQMWLRQEFLVQNGAARGDFPQGP